MTSPTLPLRLGTRASPLAMAQAHMVRDALCAVQNWPVDAIEIKAMTASGDKIADRSLADIGGKALWTKELDWALVAREIDFAVHSMKDVETVRPEEITIAAMLERADARDRLIGAASISAIAHGARIGTNSPRRMAQLAALRPDLDFVLFRGNVATRLSRIDAGEAEATLLAAAGLDRLGMSDVGVAIPISQMLPAASQGAIGIETLSDNAAVLGILRSISHQPTHDAVLAERRLLDALSAGCHSPVAAYAQPTESGFILKAELLLPDGSERVAGEIDLHIADDAAKLGAQLLSRASPKLRALFGA